MNKPANDNIVLTLTRGLVSIIDAADFARVGQWSWSAIPARSTVGKFYAVRSARKGEIGGQVYLHREIIGADAGDIVDHINGDPLDNRRCNLRVCNLQQNRWNSLGLGSSSGFIGVTHRPLNPHRPYYAGIKSSGRARHLGAFETAEAAARAYDAAALAERGHFAKLNFPEEVLHDAA